jgi:hypothetical protein
MKKAGLLAILALFLFACGGTGLRAAADAMARSVNDATAALLLQYEQDGSEIIKSSPDKASAAAALEILEAAWQPVWVALDSFVSAYGLVKLALQRGKIPDVAHLLQSYCFLRILIIDYYALPDVPALPCGDP